VTNILFAFGFLLIMFFFASLYFSKFDYRTNKRWITAFLYATRVSKNKTEITDAFRFAKQDQYINSHSSPFRSEAEKEFGDHLKNWVHEGILEEDVPTAVFKTLLHGYHFMAHLEENEIDDALPTLKAFNDVLPANGFEKLADDELNQSIERLNAIEDTRTRRQAILKQLEDFSKRIQGHLLWLEEKGQTLTFLVVPSSLFIQLRGQRLDDDHKFTDKVAF